MSASHRQTAEVVICGAGIAGVSVAYFLSVEYGLKGIILVDQATPLSLTSDKSSECYRNWWPGPDDAMLQLMNHSIDWLEKLADLSGNVFHLNRRGYLYCLSDPSLIPSLLTESQIIANLGAMPLRIHDGSLDRAAYQPAPAEGFQNQPDGADFLLDRSLISTHFPFLSDKVCAALHVRRAGWFSAQQFGMVLFDQARAHGVRFINDKVTGIDVQSQRLQAVRLAGGQSIHTRCFVNAAGPLIEQISQLINLPLPVFHELHLKVNFLDTLGVLDRSAPLVIHHNPHSLSWSTAERQLLEEDEETRWLLRQFPAGAHTRPDGPPDSQAILLLWDYHTPAVQPSWPISPDPQSAEIILRGLSTIIPGLQAYLGKFPRPTIDGGYYTRTRENRPLIGPTPIEGAYLIGALSGFGLMAAAAAGDLLAATICAAPLPTYAQSFSLERYQDPNYQIMLENWGETGQL
jgi:glycine/D-amino acid oxidase-like deaminating enzyme